MKLFRQFFLLSVAQNSKPINKAWKHFKGGVCRTSPATPGEVMIIFCHIACAAEQMSRPAIKVNKIGKRNKEVFLE